MKSKPSTVIYAARLEDGSSVWFHSPDVGRIAKGEKYIRADKVDQILRALESANEVCRSAAQIAKRLGRETNWIAFEKNLLDSLQKQFEALKEGEL